MGVVAEPIVVDGVILCERAAIASVCGGRGFRKTDLEFDPHVRLNMAIKRVVLGANKPGVRCGTDSLVARRLPADRVTLLRG